MIIFSLRVGQLILRWNNMSQWNWNVFKFMQDIIRERMISESDNVSGLLKDKWMCSIMKKNSPRLEVAVVE